MLTRIFFLAFLSSLLFIGCKEDISFKFSTPKKINIDQKLELSVGETNGTVVDSVHFYLNGLKIAGKNNAKINLQDQKLGKHLLTATLFFQGQTKKLNNFIHFLAAQKPVIYDFKIINTFPHDSDAFTQGFEYHKGFIYESTGGKGTSFIRKTVLKTGKTLQQKDLNSQYFGEGITLFNNKIYQLTWQSKKGFTYDLNTFEPLKSFAYGESNEGWGLTHNDQELIKSDGTERIWFLDPQNLQEKRFIEAYTNKRKAERLNEIEYVKGKIYANIWQKNTIIIIDPKNGTIEGIINLNKLRNSVDLKEQNKDAVLNGIAYDSENDRLFVTGKNWNKTFEIKLFPQNPK
jgi:glutamine cyclotransferase